MITDYITHEEAVIQHFIEDPELADIMLQDAIAEGDINEIRKIQRRINEAKAKSYWNSLIDNAKQTAQTGRNLENVIELMNKALDILKSAAPARA